MHFVAARLQKDVGENRECRAGTDDVLDLLQSFEEFFFGDAEFHEADGRLRCKAFDFVRQPQSRANLQRFKRAVDEGNRLANAVLLFHAPLHQFAGMQDGPVITSAKGFADLVQRCLGQFARQIHRNLPRESDVGRAPLARHVGQAHVEMFGHAALNLFDRNRITRFLLQNVFEHVLNDFLGELLAA